MTKTIMILAIAAAFVAGTIATGTLIYAQGPPAQPGPPLGAHTVKYLKVLDQPTNDDALTRFQIDVICDKDFLVHALIATVNDPDSTIDIQYDDVNLVGSGFGFNQVPTSWFIKHVDLNPSSAESQKGFELLSQMEIERSVGVAANGKFTVFGDVTASTDESDDTIDLGAIVTTSQDAQCSVSINP